MERSAVQFFQTAGKMHEARMGFTVNQSVEVAEFVEGHLGGSFQGSGGGPSIFDGSLAEAAEGYQSDPPVLTGFAEHMAENRQEQVDVQDGDNLVDASERPVLHGPQDGSGIELESAVIQGVMGVAHRRQNLCGEIQKAAYVGGDHLGNHRGNATHGHNADTVRAIHFRHALSSKRSIFLCRVTRLMPSTPAARVMFHAQSSRVSRM